MKNKPFRLPEIISINAFRRCGGLGSPPYGVSVNRFVFVAVGWKATLQLFIPL
ncbi:MAG: hypothetical protein IJ187_08270 [Neisseriaceae bacterium]|nr:hypothetical protein [Neisseriaceae bacterium]